MRVTIRLFAVLRERAGRDSVVLEEVPDGATVGDLKRLAAEAFPRLGDLGSAAGVIGTTYASADTPVQEGDDVAFLPPVSGGSGRGGSGRGGSGRGGSGQVGPEPLEAGAFELSASPIQIASIQERVGHPSCGAIVLFTGVTRETNRGQDVVELDYEAFEEMAGPEMARIFEDCLERFGPANSAAEPERLRLRMLAVHRTGIVPVGEPSVAIAVASPHRDAAFLAARFLIDTLKERLPVWKKEVYRDGHHWIGDRS